MTIQHILFAVFVLLCITIVIGDHIERRRRKRETQQPTLSWDQSRHATQTLTSWQSEHELKPVSSETQEAI